MDKHHSCLNTRAIIEYFEAQSPEAVPALLAGLGPEITALPDPLAFLMEINNWVSSETVIQMFHNARRITGQENIAFDIGFQSAARKKLGYVQRILLLALKDPRLGLKRVQAINDKFNKNKTIEIVKTTRDRAVIRLHWLPHIPGIIDFCWFNQGIYSGIFQDLEPAAGPGGGSPVFLQRRCVLRIPPEMGKKVFPPGILAAPADALVFAQVHHRGTGAGQRAAEI